MCASLHTTALTALTLIASSALATAAEVRVLTVGSTQVAAKAIAADFEMQTRNQVTFTIRPPFDIDKELAEKTFDVIILSVPAMDIHDKTGSLAPTSRVALARVGVGVVVKEGAPLPDVSTPEKLKAAVLARTLPHPRATRLPSSASSMRSRARRTMPRSQAAANWSPRARSRWASSTSPKSRRA